MKSLFNKLLKRNSNKTKKYTVIRREVTKKEIEENQKKLRKIELEVEERSNKKTGMKKHYNSLEEMILENGYMGEIHE